MFPIFDAILLEGKNMSGGTTRPVLISAIKGNQVKKFVVKIFTPDPYIAQTASEFYGNVLATEFDITTPEVALINFSADFIETLPDDIKKRVRLHDQKFFFGSEYHEGFVQYVPSKDYNTFDMWDIQNVFAFDVLIRNVDRKVAKPNLLIQRDNYLAIDHELCFNITQTFDQYVEGDGFKFIRGVNGPGYEHIFRERLQSARNHIDFSLPEEYCGKMDSNKILNAASFLDNIGIPTGDVARINSYLCDIKKNSSKFINLCRQLLA